MLEMSFFIRCLVTKGLLAMAWTFAYPYIYFAFCLTGIKQNRCILLIGCQNCDHDIYGIVLRHFYATLKIMDSHSNIHGEHFLMSAGSVNSYLLVFITQDCEFIFIHHDKCVVVFIHDPGYHVSWSNMWGKLIIS